MPKISAIVAIYNSAEYLKKTLWSLTNQTLKDIEIIAVNDGSTDNSLSVIEEYAVNDSRIIVINKENGGVVSSRCTGQERAKGEYIHYVDGDDYLELNAYELLYQKAIENDADMVLMNYFEDDKKMKFEEIQTKFSNIDLLKYHLENCRFNPLWQNIHRRSLYQHPLHYEKIHWGEDALLNAQLFYYSAKIIYFDECLYHWVYRESAGSYQKMEIRDNYWHTYYDALQKFLSNKPEFSKLEKSIFTLYALQITHLFRNRYFKNAHLRSKRAMTYIKKYPEIANNRIVRPYIKPLKLYAINSYLGRAFIQYYILKKKIE